MSTSHLGRAVQFICAQRGTTQTQIAANAGLSQVILSRACNGTRPEQKTLHALCNSQPAPRDNLDLLVGHLRDEIERAGHSTHEIEIKADITPLDDDLRVLLDEARHDEQLAGMLRQLASFVRTHPLQTESLSLAAEDQAPYDAAHSLLETANEELQAAARRKDTPPAPAPKPPARPRDKTTKSSSSPEQPPSV
jgi:transcriptional regulator with XRE-family HTH domain